jgi:hypothetical protein
VVADDVDAAKAAVRALDGLRDALITVDESGPGRDPWWLFLPIEVPERLR